MKYFFSFIGFLALFSPLSVKAGTDFVKTSHVEVRMIAESKTVQPGTPLSLGFHFQIKPGWHTYWQNPGDSGEAPRVKWETSREYSGTPLQFPVPQRIEIPPLANFGYSHEVTYLSQVKPSADLKEGQVLTLKADLSWLVCEETCIPEKGSFEMSLPLLTQAPEPEEKYAALFKALNIPRLEEAREASLRFKENEILLSLKEGPGLPEGPLSAAFFPAEGGIVDNAAVQEILKTPREIQIRLKKSEILQVPPPSFRGLLVLKEPKDLKAFWVLATQKESAAFPWKALPLAFLGGLLLNLMPCVFPVLSIKILAFIKKSSQGRAKILRHGFAYTLGVLVSFWILAGALFLLKLSGQQIGWGFQLQSPAFLWVLSLLLFFMALSLLGLFEFGNSIMEAGQSLAGRQGYSGSFFTGVLATLVSTPCVGPFMGPALTVALSQPLGFSYLVFTALGLGLALPYLVLSAHPAWLRLLPKPGAWMETFKQAMAFPLLATVLWLLWVFSLQTGLFPLIRALGGLLLLSLGVWIASRLRSANWKKAVVFLSLLLALAAGLQGAQEKASSATPTENAAAAGLHWAPYSPEALENLRKEGRPVFVDFTAAWCLTCQVNERSTLSSKEVIRRFSEKGVATLKADWTQPNEMIARELKRFGREGVPLYVLYGKGTKATYQILPQILTPKILLEALDTIPSP